MTLKWQLKKKSRNKCEPTPGDSCNWAVHELTVLQPGRQRLEVFKERRTIEN